MAKQLFANNAKGRLNAGITDIATTLTLQAGQGALFPNPTAGDWFLATLVDTSGNVEIVKVTTRATDTFSVIVRAQEGTANIAFLASDICELRSTKGTLEQIQNDIIAFIVAGTRMLFQQTAAPTGWTKEVSATYNDVALRITTGTVTVAGTGAFTTVFNAATVTDGHALSIAETAAHTHTGTTGTESVTHTHAHPSGIGSAASGNVSFHFSNAGFGTMTTTTESANHTHSFTSASTGSGTAHTHAMLALAVKYADVIIAVKD